MAEPHAHSQPIQTYGPAPHNRNIWSHNSRAPPSRLADSFVLIVPVYPLLMTTSHLFSMMFSTGCQSHSASSTNSVYTSFNHYTELLPSICEIAALQLIPPRPGYDCDHLRGLIYVCGG